MARARLTPHEDFGDALQDAGAHGRFADVEACDDVGHRLQLLGEVGDAGGERGRLGGRVKLSGLGGELLDVGVVVGEGVRAREEGDGAGGGRGDVPREVVGEGVDAVDVRIPEFLEGEQPALRSAQFGDAADPFVGTSRHLPRILRTRPAMCEAASASASAACRVSVRTVSYSVRTCRAVARMASNGPFMAPSSGSVSQW